MKLAITLTGVGLMFGLLGVMILVWDSWMTGAAVLAWAIGLAVIVSGYLIEESPKTPPKQTT